MPRADPGYRLADQDVEFLNSDDTRGVRLELEYLKAESLLRSHGVRETILVMGSTRATRRNPYYRVARAFGRLVARASDAAVMTGGGPGIMEAANRGALEAGGVSIGLNIDLPREQAPNGFLTPGLSLRFRYFALRKLHFLLRARAMVAFPGGFGTFDELFETLTLVQCRKIAPIPIVLVGEAYWTRAVRFDVLAAEGMIDRRDLRLFRYADTAPAIWDAIRGAPLRPAARAAAPGWRRPARRAGGGASPPAASRRSARGRRRSPPRAATRGAAAGSRRSPRRSG
ncbi:MAG TPA: TIGR00730 family Rossman fold protein [Burkholderiales bacterium]|nr:TIGR00730 family Rossman fold protein [Burkholderiales bacterium]